MRGIDAYPARTQLTHFTRICPASSIYYRGSKQSAGARSCFPAEAQPSLRRVQTKSRARLRPNRSESSRTDQFLQFSALEIGNPCMVDTNTALDRERQSRRRRRALLRPNRAFTSTVLCSVALQPKMTIGINPACSVSWNAPN
jgi:hypothetical protein